MNRTIGLCIFVKTQQLKKLDWLIIRTFLGPFILTFFIAVFVLVMQFLWRHIEDLASKGLDLLTIGKLLFYASASLVPMALPIAVLLSSIMTLGSTAESLELVAAKSSGVSLYRSIRPVFMMSVLIGAIAFLFANNVLPVANFKLKGIISEIARTMPAIDIQEGTYYDGLKGFTIMIEKKEKDQKTFYGLVVYDHTQNTGGAENIVKASKGDITVSDDGNLMILNLQNGVRYSDMNFYSQKQKGNPFSREFFREQHIIIDISEQNQKNNTSSNYIGNQYTMMTVGQLNIIRDEIRQDMKKTAGFLVTRVNGYYAFAPVAPNPQLQNEQLDYYLSVPIQANDGYEKIPEIVRDSTIPYRNIEKVEFGAPFLEPYTDREKGAILQAALDQVSSIKVTFDRQIGTQKSKKMNLVRNRREFHKKFTLSFACILLFFIGAPLGAIIKKGGLGLPLIFSIVIFILYYVASTIFERLVMNLTLDLTGMWISSFILLPFGLFLTIKASTDSSLFSLSTYTKPFKRLFGRRTA